MCERLPQRPERVVRVPERILPVQAVEAVCENERPGREQDEAGRQDRPEPDRRTSRHDRHRRIVAAESRCVYKPIILDTRTRPFTRHGCPSGRCHARVHRPPASPPVARSRGGPGRRAGGRLCRHAGGSGDPAPPGQPDAAGARVLPARHRSHRCSPPGMDHQARERATGGREREGHERAGGGRPARRDAAPGLQRPAMDPPQRVPGPDRQDRGGQDRPVRLLLGSGRPVPLEDRPVGAARHGLARDRLLRQEGIRGRGGRAAG